MVYFSIIYKQETLLYITIGLNGFANLSINGVMYELGVEVTYQEVGEATSAGLLNLLINVLQFVFIMILTPILDKRSHESVLISMVFLLGVAFIGVIFTFIAPITYKRSILMIPQTIEDTATSEPSAIKIE